MAAPLKPGTHSVLQMESFWLVPEIAAAAAGGAPTDLEINAAGSFYITCFLTEEGSTGWTVTFNKGTGLRLICQGNTPEVLLPTTTAGADIIGVVDPQAAEAATDKAAFEFLRDGFAGYLVRRQNKANHTDDEVTSGEFVDYAPVDITNAITDKSAATAEGRWIFRAGVAVTGDPTYNVAVAVGAP